MLSPSKNIDILSNGMLVLPSIRKNFSGRYYCQAETDNGAVRSSSVTIDIKDAGAKVVKPLGFSCKCSKMKYTCLRVSRWIEVTNQVGTQGDREILNKKAPF